VKARLKAWAQNVWVKGIVAGAATYLAFAIGHHATLEWHDYQIMKADIIFIHPSIERQRQMAEENARRAAQPAPAPAPAPKPETPAPAK
jgi:hypothetical protein